MNNRRKQDANIALCYVRQSYTRDANDMTSPERQRANIERVLEKNGYQAEWFEDVDGHKSGRHVNNRPGWLALSQRLQDDDIAVLIANDLSRLHRKGWRVGDLIDHLEQYEVDLVIAEPGREVDTSTPMGRMFIYFTAIFDEYYADDISQRIKSSVDHRRRQGKLVGPIPFGTERNKDGYLLPSPEGVWLIPDGSWQATAKHEQPDDQAIWRGYYEAAQHVLTTYAGGQAGFTRLKDKMNDEGWAFRQRDGSPRRFKREDIRRIVANWLEYGGEVDTVRRKDRPGYNELMPDAIELNEERAVFPIELLLKVGEVRRQRSHKPLNHGTKQNTHYYPLSNILYCAHCEALSNQHQNPQARTSMSGMISHNILRYRHKSPVKCDCSVRTVRASVVEADFKMLIDELTVNPTVYDVMLTHAQRIDAQRKAEQSNLALERQQQINICKRKLHAANHLYLDGEIDTAEYEVRRDHAKRDLNYWESYEVDIEEVALKLQTCIEAFQSLGKLWDKANNAERQAMVRNLFSYVVYNLETQCIVDFRLQPWADEFLVLRAALYDGGVATTHSGAELQNATALQKKALRHVPRGVQETNPTLLRIQSISLNRLNTLIAHNWSACFLLLRKVLHSPCKRRAAQRKGDINRPYGTTNTRNCVFRTIDLQGLEQ